MTRRLFLFVATLGVVLGPLTLTYGVASASSSSTKFPTFHLIQANGFRSSRPMSRAGAFGAPSYSSRTTVSSSNWSGYVLSDANGTFRSVSATWAEPAATCPSTQVQYASFWVGLDGYKSHTVEQTGSDSDCIGNTPSYYGWYEMYPAYPVNFPNPVSPGDVMSASVAFSGTKTYTLVLKDVTRGWTQTITKNASGLDRSSAEVITEAPTGSAGVLPLSDFGTVKYKKTMANGESMGTQTPIEIVMDDSSGVDKDSTSPITSTGKFHNTWIRST